MNPMGSDVLRRMGSVDPNGDIELPDADEKPVRSVLTDICVGRGGVYSVLDTRQGRVFTYDNDGNMLYVCLLYTSGGHVYRCAANRTVRLRKCTD